MRVVARILIISHSNHHPFVANCFRSLARPKILDFVDCTGAGDVNTRTVRHADSHGLILGLSGRWLRVVAPGGANALWENPSGQWRVGLLEGYDIFPAPLIARVKRQRKIVLERHRRSFLAAAQQGKAAAAAGSAVAEESDARLALLEEKVRCKLMRRSYRIFLGYGESFIFYGIVSMRLSSSS